MRYLGYERNGEPGAVLALRDGDEPQAKMGEVVVALEAAPLHIADLLAVRGELDFIARGGGVPGFEGVGRIVALGEGVTRWRVGERVILPMAYGALQERRALPADALWPAPEDVAPQEIALARINLATAWLLLNAYETMRPGEVVLQNAANANVAGYVAALGDAQGLTVIDLVRREEAARALREAGRRHVLVDGPDLPARLSGLGLAPPRLALDAVGGAATRRLGACTANGGLVLAYGFLAHEPYALDYPDMMFRDVRLRAMMTDRALARVGEDGQARMARAVFDVLASGRTRAEIAGVYPFSRFREAFAHAARTGEARQGKVILVPE
ncbi:zinc-dependent alcohol dehydrogenase family protein [Novosphingobium profundi]|uniref:zinc-dependent alcohol dehydrogenase family protein n=1 Tax=Novosphingobium profundi TaxID=1774954 RepID=UPI001BDA7932|nr:zinc-dependent alcohol dehydrogenase family protein [Novosphingobium profundi]MBT0670378.1 zinc-dependent alcohol dehydrogenase family protein [Novosphingobium profundi]